MPTPQATAAAALLRQGQFQGNTAPNILDTDPGTFGPGRDDLFEQYAKAAAMRGLSLANQQKQQTIDAADPEKQRITTLDNANVMGSAARNGAFDDLDSYGVKKASNLILGQDRAKNEAQIELEADPQHQSFVDRQAQNGINRLIAPIEAKAALTPEKPLGAMNENRMATYEDTSDIAQRLIDLIDKYDAQAKSFKAQHGVLSQIPAVGSAMFKNQLYKNGFTNPDDDEQWLAGMLQAKGLAASANGRLTVGLAKILQSHLTDPSFDFARNREAAVNLLGQAKRSQANLVGAHRGTLPSMGGGGDPMGIR